MKLQASSGFFVLLKYSYSGDKDDRQVSVFVFLLTKLGLLMIYVPTHVQKVVRFSRGIRIEELKR